MFWNEALVRPAAIWAERSVVALNSVPGIAIHRFSGSPLSHAGVVTGTGGGSDENGCSGRPSEARSPRPPSLWLPARRNTPHPAPWRNCRRVGTWLCDLSECLVFHSSPVPGIAPDQQINDQLDLLAAGLL